MSPNKHKFNTSTLHFWLTAPIMEKNLIEVKGNGCTVIIQNRKQPHPIMWKGLLFYVFIIASNRQLRCDTYQIRPTKCSSFILQSLQFR